MVADATLREQSPGRGEEVGDVRALVVLFSRLAAATVRICLRHRVTGLAAEAGFFALLSLPPLVLGLAGTVGYVGQRMGTDVVNDLRVHLSELASTVLTTDAVSTVILPTFDDVVGSGRADIISIGFVLSLWSGSRALNVYVDTISIMYGLGGQRGIIRTRALSFSLYVAALLIGVVLIPLVLLGPGLLQAFLAQRIDGLPSLSWLGYLYWPVVTSGTVIGLATLYHIATPVRTPWRRDLPGAVLALVIWVLASLGLRVVIGASVDGSSIYGPLATPIVVLIWLYFFAIAVLIGAALNAAVDERWPYPARVLAREEGGPHASETPVTPFVDPQDRGLHLRPDLPADPPASPPADPPADLTAEGRPARRAAPD